jgi:FlaA1/EpsC-like NDP-sugar epimerase
VNSKRNLGLRVARRLALLRADVSFAAVDALLVMVAYGAALMLRFVDLPEGVPTRWWESFGLVIPLIVAIHILSNIAFGAYGHVWQFASIAEAVKIVLANICAGATLLVGLFVFRAVSDESGPIPIGSLALGALLTVALMGAVRFRTRLFSLHRIEAHSDALSRVLIVGTAKPAVDLARHLARLANVEVVGFVGTERFDSGRRLADRPVLGQIEAVPDLVKANHVDEVIVATENGSPIVRRLIDLCLSVDVRLRIIPDIDSVLVSDNAVQDVRDLEPDDLLERASVHTDLEPVARLLSGVPVMVTGAGGSIGSELVRQIASFGPSRVIALDHDETHLHQAQPSWEGLGVEIEPVLCDIRDRTRLMRVMANCRPKIVFHAAAHKHVPILEKHPEEAVKTNILGTMMLIEAVKRSEVERFVLISTDKAASPVGVMGASKRVAEMLIQSEASNSGNVHFSAVRFGNVLGSRGSVVPTFVDQINRGGPVRVTDKEMTRYFMTIREAVELVLQASAIADPGRVLVLDMGEPVKIVDLAHRLIRMAGLVPGRDIKVEYTGAREGERLHEMLSTVPLIPSEHPRISIADQGFPAPITLMDKMNKLIRLAAQGDALNLRESLMAVAQSNGNAKVIEMVATDMVVDLREAGALSDTADWSPSESEPEGDEVPVYAGDVDAAG